MSERLIMLASGGTGGHLFPAEALALQLLERGLRVALITDRRGRGFAALPAVATYPIHAAGLLGRSTGQRALAVAALGWGTLEAWRLIGQLEPAAIAGFGGYASVPAVLAGGLRGVPTILHDQNAVLGRANRWLARRASALALSFPATGHLPTERRGVVTVTGNPVRPTIAAIGQLPYAAPTGAGPIRLLITGGSQGARVFGDLLPAACAALPPALRQRLRIVQQVRPEGLRRVQSAYQAVGIAAELASFFPDLPERLAACHLAIGRAGASTVAELTAAGRPAILIPLPGAIDDHQRANARWLAAVGGALVVEQDDTNDRTGLAGQLAALLAAPERLAALAAAARRAAQPDAARTLADLVIALTRPPARLAAASGLLERVS